MTFLGSMASLIVGPLGAAPIHEPNFAIADSRHWVVMVTQPDCDYCVRLEKEVLKPLRASGIFAEKVKFTEVDLYDGFITDFDNSRIESDDFASRYQGFGTPTLLFLSAQGDVLAPAIFGIPDAIDFFAHDIEQIISKLP